VSSLDVLLLTYKASVVNTLSHNNLRHVHPELLLKASQELLREVASAMEVLVKFFGP
jgi:hypothetical protein